MTIRFKNQLNRFYKHKPQLVAPIINMVYCSKGRGGQNHGGAEQNNTGSNHIPSSNNSWREERGCGER